MQHYPAPARCRPPPHPIAPHPTHQQLLELLQAAQAGRQLCQQVVAEGQDLKLGQLGAHPVGQALYAVALQDEHLRGRQRRRSESARERQRSGLGGKQGLWSGSSSRCAGAPALQGSRPALPSCCGPALQNEERRTLRLVRWRRGSRSEMRLQESTTRCSEGGRPGGSRSRWLFEASSTRAPATWPTSGGSSCGWAAAIRRQI